MNQGTSLDPTDVQRTINARARGHARPLAGAKERATAQKLPTKIASSMKPLTTLDPRGAHQTLTALAPEFAPQKGGAKATPCAPE